MTIVAGMMAMAMDGVITVMRAMVRRDQVSGVDKGEEGGEGGGELLRRVAPDSVSS